MAADGSVVIEAALDDKKAKNELSRLEKKIESLQGKIARDTGEQMPLIDQANELGARLDAAKAKLEELQAAPTGTVSKDQLAYQTDLVKMLQTQYNAADRSVQRYDASIQKSTDDLAQAEARAGELTAQLSAAGGAGGRAGEDTAAGFSLANTSVGKLERRIMGLAKRVFVFSLITRALRSVRSWLSNVVKQNDEAATAIARLRGSLLTLAQPLIQVVIPAFTSFINVLTQVVSAIASVVAALFGTTATSAANAAEALYNEQNAIKGVGGAAKKAERQLAGFDEINKLSEDTGGGAASAITPLFDAIKNYKLPDWVEDLTTKLKLTIDDVLFDWTDLNGEQIAEKAIAGIAGIAGAVAGFTIGGVPGAVKGALLGVTLGLIISALTFDHDGKLGKEELLKMIVLGVSGLTGAAFGLALTHSAKGAAIGFLVGAVVGLVINKLTFNDNGRVSGAEKENLLRTAIMGLLGGITGFVIGGGPLGAVIGASIGVALSLVLTSAYARLRENVRTEAVSEELAALIDASLTGGEAALEASVQMKANISSITSEVSPEKLADLDRARMLVSEIFALDEQDNKTAGQIALLQAKIKELNDIGLDGVQISFDETTQAVIGTKEEILKTIDALLQQYQVEALKEAYIEQYKKQYEALLSVKENTIGLNEATAAYQTALENLTRVQDENRASLEASMGGLGTSFSGLAEITAKLDVAKEAVEDAKAAQDAWAGALENSLSAYDSTIVGVSDLKTAYEELVVSISESTEDAKKGGENIMAGTAEGINAGYTTAEQAITDAHKALQAAANDVDGIHSPSTVYKEHGRNMMRGLANGITDNAYLAEDAIRAVLNSLAALAETGINNIVKKFNTLAVKLNKSSEDTGITVPTLSTVSIPRLAQGAVIPPNREFLAVLGDQTSGRNIEAPEAALRAMAQEAASANTALLRDILTAIREGRVLMVDRTVLGKTSQGAIFDAQRMGYA